MQPDLRWQKCGEFADIVYEKADGIARVTINRPHRRNAFTQDTVAELLKAFSDARDDATIGVVLLRGATRTPVPSVSSASAWATAGKSSASFPSTTRTSFSRSLARNSV